MNSEGPTTRSSKVPGRFGWVPFFFLSAALFSSRLFVFFSPLPLLWLAFAPPSGLPSGRTGWVFALAWLSNLACVRLLEGPQDAWFYALTVGVLTAVLPVALRRFRTVNTTATVSFLTVLAAVAVFIAAYGAKTQLNLFVEFKSAILQLLDESLNSLPQESRRALLGELTPEEWKQGLWREIPWIGASYLLMLVVINLGLLIRLNPAQLRTRLGLGGHLFRSWKAPEWLLWPTILMGFLALMDWGRLSWMGTNLLKLSLTVYAIQGLSILSSLFSAWRLRRVWRWMAYGLVASVMTPIVLSLGFFDQWFDFRSRFRQT